jgi:hypothetical protein
LSTIYKSRVISKCRALVIAKSAILTPVTPSVVPVESGSLSVTTAPSLISAVPVGASPIVKVKVAADDSVPNVFNEVTLAT